MIGQHKNKTKYYCNYNHLTLTCTFEVMMSWVARALIR